MKTGSWDRRNRSKASIAISVAIHVLAAASLMTITFHYPIAELFQRPEPAKAIPVKFIPLTARTQPPAGNPNGGAPDRATRRTPLPAVGSIPVGIPAPPELAAPPAPTGIAIGAGGSTAAGGRDPGIGFGLRPGIPDGRLATNPMSVPRVPETEGRRAERAIDSIYNDYLESARAAIANRGREPGDWSWGGKDGDKWGWDKYGIHVGGVTIPNVVLAALPIPVTPNTEPVNARAREFMRSDIQSHAGLMTQDEFKAAVRRVRERVDRERRERMEKEKTRAGKKPPA